MRGVYFVGMFVRKVERVPTFLGMILVLFANTVSSYLHIICWLSRKSTRKFSLLSLLEVSHVPSFHFIRHQPNRPIRPAVFAHQPICTSTSAHLHGFLHLLLLCYRCWCLACSLLLNPEFWCNGGQHLRTKIDVQQPTSFLCLCCWVAFPGGEPATTLIVPDPRSGTNEPGTWNAASFRISGDCGAAKIKNGGAVVFVWKTVGNLIFNSGQWLDNPVLGGLSNFDWNFPNYYVLKWHCFNFSLEACLYILDPK